MKPIDIKIEIFPLDEEDNKYCAIVMLFGKGWYNCGIVVRDLDPIVAFTKAMELAITYEYWI